MHNGHMECRIFIGHSRKDLAAVKPIKEELDREWRYAFNTKGIEGIEPVPIEPAETCPPPEELSKLHFNDYLQYLAYGITSAHGC